ncbi:hypothetical protein CZ797_08680 [Pseudoalteromonas sp. JB197]|nr:hypothetical protein CZ797_08680 [Pseudoalteromonas sp. JB197]
MYFYHCISIHMTSKNLTALSEDTFPILAQKRPYFMSRH